ncbi:MAG: hypothetical protein AAF495_25435 [Pseudomonadota bacterium]
MRNLFVVLFLAILLVPQAGAAGVEQPMSNSGQSCVSAINAEVRKQTALKEHADECSGGWCYRNIVVVEFANSCDGEMIVSMESGSGVSLGAQVLNPGRTAKLSCDRVLHGTCEGYTYTWRSLGNRTSYQDVPIGGNKAEQGGAQTGSGMTQQTVLAYPAETFMPGKWTGHTTSPYGDNDAEFEIRIKNGQVSGEYVNLHGWAPWRFRLHSAHLSGESMTVTSTSGSTSIQWTLRLVANDRIEGNWQQGRHRGKIYLSRID